MIDYSQSNDFILDNISLKQIQTLSEVIADSSLDDIEFISAKYSERVPNFVSTIGFLKNLKLIQIIDNKVVPSPIFKELLNTISHQKSSYPTIKTFLINYILRNSTDFTEYLRQFLSHFHFEGSNYQFRPTLSQRLEYSGLRNLLIELEFITYEPTEIKYVITDEYTFAYPKLMQANVFSPKELSSYQQQMELLGQVAEIRLLDYEKDRLNKYPHLVEKIEHIATSDIAAGYDIKSWECSENGEYYPRLIEVKAVSILNYKFNWSRNEIEIARNNRSNYCLYLLPALGKGKFDIDNLRIIFDPITRVYENRNNWICTEELLSFSLSSYISLTEK